PTAPPPPGRSPSEQPFLLVALVVGRPHLLHLLAKPHLFHLLAKHRGVRVQLVEVLQDRLKLEPSVDVVVWHVVHAAPWTLNSRHCCGASMLLSIAFLISGAFSYRSVLRTLSVP